MAGETPKLERLYTPEEAAEVLRVKPRTVVVWLKTGKLGGIQIGERKLWRVRESDLMTFIEKGQPG